MDCYLNHDNPIKKVYIEAIKNSVVEVDKLRDIEHITDHFRDYEEIEKAYLSNVDPATGIVTINLEAPNDLYNQALKEIVKIDVTSKA